MLIVYSDCKNKEKVPFRGLKFGIKGIQIEKMQENKCNSSLSPSTNLLFTIDDFSYHHSARNNFLSRFTQNNDPLFCAKRYF